MAECLLWVRNSLILKASYFTLFFKALHLWVPLYEKEAVDTEEGVRSLRVVITRSICFISFDKFLAPRIKASSRYCLLCVTHRESSLKTGLFRWDPEVMLGSPCFPKLSYAALVRNTLKCPLIAKRLICTKLSWWKGYPCRPCFTFLPSSVLKCNGLFLIILAMCLNICG